MEINNFKVIYKILKYLEYAMDLTKIDTKELSYIRFGISQNRFNKIIKMLQDNGYIQGVVIESYIDGELNVNLTNVEITLKGLEYLEDNSIMKKFENIIDKAIDIVG